MHVELTRNPVSQEGPKLGTKTHLYYRKRVEEIDTPFSTLGPDSLKYESRYVNGVTNQVPNPYTGFVSVPPCYITHEVEVLFSKREMSVL